MTGALGRAVFYVAGSILAVGFLVSIFLVSNVHNVVALEADATASGVCKNWWTEAQKPGNEALRNNPPECETAVPCANGQIGEVNGRCVQDRCLGQAACGSALGGTPTQPPPASGPAPTEPPPAPPTGSVSPFSAELDPYSTFSARDILGENLPSAAQPGSLTQGSLLDQFMNNQTPLQLTEGPFSSDAWNWNDVPLVQYMDVGGITSSQVPGITLDDTGRFESFFSSDSTGFDSGSSFSDPSQSVWSRTVDYAQGLGEYTWDRITSAADTVQSWFVSPAIAGPDSLPANQFIVDGVVFERGEGVLGANDQAITRLSIYDDQGSLMRTLPVGDRSLTEMAQLIRSNPETFIGTSEFGRVGHLEFETADARTAYYDPSQQISSSAPPAQPAQVSIVTPDADMQEYFRQLDARIAASQNPVAPNFTPPQIPYNFDFSRPPSFDPPSVDLEPIVVSSADPPSTNGPPTSQPPSNQPPTAPPAPRPITSAWSPFNNNWQPTPPFGPQGFPPSLAQPLSPVRTTPSPYSFSPALPPLPVSLPSLPPTAEPPQSTAPRGENEQERRVREFLDQFRRVAFGTQPPTESTSPPATILPVWQLPLPGIALDSGSVADAPSDDTDASSAPSDRRAVASLGSRAPNSPFSLDYPPSPCPGAQCVVAINTAPPSGSTPPAQPAGTTPPGRVPPVELPRTATTDTAPVPPAGSSFEGQTPPASPPTGSPGNESTDQPRETEQRPLWRRIADAINPVSSAQAAPGRGRMDACNYACRTERVRAYTAADVRGAPARIQQAVSDVRARLRGAGDIRNIARQGGRPGIPGVPIRYRGNLALERNVPQFRYIVIHESGSAVDARPGGGMSFADEQAARGNQSVGAAWWFHRGSGLRLTRPEGSITNHIGENPPVDFRGGPLSDYMGIEVAGIASVPLSAADRERFLNAIRFLQERYNIPPENILYHGKDFGNEGRALHDMVQAMNYRPGSGLPTMQDPPLVQEAAAPPPCTELACRARVFAQIVDPPQPSAEPPTATAPQPAPRPEAPTWARMFADMGRNLLGGTSPPSTDGRTGLEQFGSAIARVLQQPSTALDWTQLWYQPNDIPPDPGASEAVRVAQAEVATLQGERDALASALDGQQATLADAEQLQRDRAALADQRRLALEQRALAEDKAGAWDRPGALDAARSAATHLGNAITTSEAIARNPLLSDAERTAINADVAALRSDLQTINRAIREENAAGLAAADSAARRVDEMYRRLGASEYDPAPYRENITEVRGLLDRANTNLTAAEGRLVALGGALPSAAPTPSPDPGRASAEPPPSERTPATPKPATPPPASWWSRLTGSSFGLGGYGGMGGLSQILQGFALYNALNQRQPQLPPQPPLAMQPPLQPQPSGTQPLPANRPAVALVANPNAIAVGSTTRLSWTAFRVTSCDVKLPSGQVLTSGGATGSATTSSLTVSTTFTISCSGQYGSRDAATRVYVGEKPPASPQTTQQAPTITTSTGGATSGQPASSSQNNSAFCDPGMSTAVFTACLEALPPSANPFQ